MGEVTPLPSAQTADEKRAAAEAERKKFMASIAGAKLRAKELPHDLLKLVAPAVANMMLVDLLNGKWRIKTADEAIRIAKLASEIGRAELGEGTGSQPLTAAERKVRIEELAVLSRELEARKAMLEDQAAGLPHEADGEAQAGSVAEASA